MTIDTLCRYNLTNLLSIEGQGQYDIVKKTGSSSWYSTWYEKAESFCWYSPWYEKAEQYELLSCRFSSKSDLNLWHRQNEDDKLVDRILVSDEPGNPILDWNKPVNPIFDLDKPVNLTSGSLGLKLTSLTAPSGSTFLMLLKSTLMV
jgi:hypothetical protein